MSSADSLQSDLNRAGSSAGSFFSCFLEQNRFFGLGSAARRQWTCWQRIPERPIASRRVSRDLYSERARRLGCLQRPPPLSCPVCLADPRSAASIVILCADSVKERPPRGLVYPCRVEHERQARAFSFPSDYSFFFIGPCLAIGFFSSHFSCA